MSFDPHVSFYPSANQPVPISDPAFTEVIEWIKSRRYRSDVEAVRARFKYLIDRGATPKEAKTHTDKVKQRLCAFNASGVFVFRKEEKMTLHSGLIQADFDLLGDRLAEIKEKLATDVHVFALFTSPTGEGLKAFYRCSPATDKPEHLRRFAAVEKHCLAHYAVQIDESVKDMSRLCFVSDDPDAQIFPDAEEIQPIDPPVVVAPASQVTENKPISRGPGPGSQQAYSNREDDPELVRSALKTIPADERSLWLKIGAGLKGTFGESGWSMFDEWSKSSEKYDAEGNRRAWDSLETTKTTIGSVFHIAKLNGFLFPHKEHSYNGQQSQMDAEQTPETGDVPQNSEGFDSAKPKPTANQERDRLVSVLETRQFNFSVIPPRPPTRYWLGETSICTAGNLTAIAAAIKSGKSSVLTAMMASAMTASPQGLDFLGFRSSNLEGHALIHIDTEQSREDHDDLVRRSIRRAGLGAPPPWLYSFCLTGMPVKDLQALLWLMMETAFTLHRGIHSVLIDGVADMVPDVNDPETSNAFVSDLHGHAILYKCPIIGIIHLNPGTEKTRGHLGSQLERKSETNLRMEREGDTEAIVLWADKTRKAPILKRTAPRFAWSDEAGMHVSVDYRPADKVYGGRPSVVDKIVSMNTHTFLQGCSKQGEGLNEIARRLESWLAEQRIDLKLSQCKIAVPLLVGSGKLTKTVDLLYVKGPNA